MVHLPQNGTIGFDPQPFAFCVISVSRRFSPRPAALASPLTLEDYDAFLAAMFAEARAQSGAVQEIEVLLPEASGSRAPERSAERSAERAAGLEFPDAWLTAEVCGL